MDLTIALKLMLAAILGGALGLERQIRDKPAGLRTNILICVGCTLFMSLSTTFGDTRIGAAIITGIGFLGAGAVLHSHGFVYGLTTAATIWVVAGVGMAIGSGWYAVAAFTTGISLITLYFMAFVEDRIQGRRSYAYILTVTDLHQALASINNALQESSVTTASFNFKKEAGQYRVWFNLYTPRETNVKIMQRLSEFPEITQVETGPESGNYPQNRPEHGRS